VTSTGQKRSTNHAIAAMVFLEPWYAVSDPDLVSELQRELVPGHLLFGKDVTAVARRQDRDDVLYALCDGTKRMAVVHLTHARESDAKWPSTTIFASIDAWKHSMEADSEQFGNN